MNYMRQRDVRKQGKPNILGGQTNGWLRIASSISIANTQIAAADSPLCLSRANPFFFAIHSRKTAFVGGLHLREGEG
jgi:hypothetical protein